MTTTKPELPDDEAVLRQFIAGEKNQCGDYWHRSTATEALDRILACRAAAPAVVGDGVSDFEFWWRENGVWQMRDLSPVEVAQLATRPAVPDGWRVVPAVAADNGVVLFCDEHANQWTDCVDWSLANSCGFPPTHWQLLPPAPRSES